jgi:hypothetical protein
LQNISLRCSVIMPNHQINLTACVATAPWRQVIWGVRASKRSTDKALLRDE